jgi:hypothetical protein
MRKRWAWQWMADEPWQARLFVALLVWVGCGLGVLIVGGIASSIVTGNDQMNLALYVVLAIGFGLPIAVSVACAVALGVIHLVRHPPVRRVTEPVREDLRSRHDD